MKAKRPLMSILNHLKDQNECSKAVEMYDELIKESNEDDMKYPKWKDINNFIVT